MAVKPISPNEVASIKAEMIPDFVIESFNALIARKFNGTVARITQDSVIDEIKSRHDIERHQIYDNHYLDVESIYMEQGWKVKYDKPAYNETYDAYFEFRK